MTSPGLIASLIGQEWLVAARVCSFDEPHFGGGVRTPRVDAVNEHHSWIACPPGRPCDAVEDILREQPRADLTSMGRDEIVFFTPLERAHETIGDRDGYVEVRDTAILLAIDELENVGVVDAQDSHIRPAPRSALLYGLGCTIEYPQEGHGAG